MSLSRAGRSSSARLPRGGRLDVCGKAAVKAFPDWARIPEVIARLAPEDYYPKNNVLPDRIEGLDLAMADAVSFKYIAAPLSKEQLAALILVPLK